MKTLKFDEPLSRMILGGEKTTTWRLFDDKNLSEGDILNFVVSQTGKEFGTGKIIHVKETTLGSLTEDDWDGHEKFTSESEMYRTYEKYYGKKVDKNTLLKIIKFKLE